MSVDVGELLRQLSEAGVEFIVLGGARAVLHGALITTEDLDIVHRRKPENVARLKAFAG
jgi:predicted nucleotidyltransferase